MLTRFWSRSVLMLLLSSMSAGAYSEEILVAVASNFTLPMQRLAAQFNADTGHELQLVFGSSGRLFAQISNGAPFQLFLSADQDKPQRLEEQGQAVPGSRFTYAVGRLVLWSNSPDVRITGPEVLRNSSGRLALANPRLAPYGRAAEQVLTNLDLLEATRDRLVQGENIAQTFQFVETGNAQMGFVALSQVISEYGLDNVWQVETELYDPVRQDAVLLNRARDCSACKELMEFLQSARVQRIIQSSGYGI